MIGNVRVRSTGFRKALITPTDTAAIAAAVRVLIVTPGTIKSTTSRLRAVATPDKRMLHISHLLGKKYVLTDKFIDRMLSGLNQQ